MARLGRSFPIKPHLSKGRVLVTTTAYSLVLGGGTFTITGASVGLKVGYKTALGGGTYTITGAAVTLTRSTKTLVLGGGAYSVTGASLTLKRTYVFVLGGGTYTITGASVTLTYHPVQAVLIGMICETFVVPADPTSSVGDSDDGFSVKADSTTFTDVGC